ncbi:MAG: hypothetical protein JNK82_27975 [Myxococcaceae bacterium]|nr:hypothetical protein [Myxococcaceae bacterium]
MSTGRYEVVGRLPPGQGRKTLLAVIGGAFKRIAVLRPVEGASLFPVANLSPKLPAPLSVDEVEGTSYAVYDFFPGATLFEIAQVYREQDQLPPLGLAARIVIEAARIVHLAHEHVDALGHASGFVHGGLGDSALLMGFDGEVRVIDFGLRKSNRFASPEAVNGGPYSAQSDVFSLAAALHAALTGFEKQYAAVVSKPSSPREFPPPSTIHPDATQELDSLLMRALLPDPDSRLASALELADDLERIVGAQLPAPQACATRLRQLFEERLDGLRNMVPKLTADGPPPAGAPKPRASKPSTSGQHTAVPRKSGPRPSIPMGTQPEVNPVGLVGKRPTPPEVKAPFGDDDGLDDERTIVGDPLPEPSRPPAPRGSGLKKKVPAPLPEVPWEDGALRPNDDALAIEDVPTGVSKRHTGAFTAVGGSTHAEKARAKGQELVDTGEIEGDEADDLRDQPTVVRVTGLHGKLKVEPPADEEVAEAFGDPDAGDEGLPEEPGTAIITSRESPKAMGAVAPPGPGVDPNGPPVLLPVSDVPSPAAGAAGPSGTGDGPLDGPDTGVLEHNKPKPQPEAKTEDEKPKKKRRGGALLAILLLLLTIAALFVAGMVKKPELMKAKLGPVAVKADAVIVKLGLRKVQEPPPAPPPEEPPPVVADADAGEPAAPVALPPEVVPDAGAPQLAPLEDDLDGGEDEYEDDDGGTASDGGRHGDGGVTQKVKKVKRKKRKEWWKTQ